MAKTPAKKEAVETPAPAPAPVAKADPPKKAPAVNKDPQPKVEVLWMRITVKLLVKRFKAKRGMFLLLLLISRNLWS
jgi:hypothetical protein